jgi:hypothetical protein
VLGGGARTHLITVTVTAVEESEEVKCKWHGKAEQPTRSQRFMGLYWSCIRPNPICTGPRFCEKHRRGEHRSTSLRTGCTCGPVRIPQGAVADGCDVYLDYTGLRAASGPQRRPGQGAVHRVTDSLVAVQSSVRPVVGNAQGRALPLASRIRVLQAQHNTSWLWRPTRARSCDMY